MKLLITLAALCVVAASAAPPCTSGLTLFDKTRAKTRTPRAQYQGVGSLASANAELNKHLLARPGLSTLPCEALSVAQVRDTLRALFPLRSAELMEIYPSADGRSNVFGSAADMEAEWAALPVEDESGQQRDAHCHEAVMWFVHHLPTAVQKQFAAETTLPLLPVREHSQEGDDAVTQLYADKVTCQNCHVGGISSLHVPEVKPDTPAALARRCYTNYQDLFNLTCGPCDGISGIYWGDDDKDFKAPPCQVVAQPHEVPEAERVPPKLPLQFTVNVTGSDRFGRTTNPAGSNIIEKTYGQITGLWHMNVLPDSKLWMLRHDTTYHQISLNGVQVPFFTTASVTEIHSQTQAQRAANISGPMVSLVHGLPSWIPGGCTCIPDPVGVPDITASQAAGLAHMQYMGRIKLDPIEYLNKTVELDHWANWFFHIFMETDKSSPVFGRAPLRLASAYAGMSVYSNWIFSDPESRIPDIWYRGIPTSPEKVGPDRGKYCLNPKKVDYCNNISQTTFPPAPEAALTADELAAAALRAAGQSPPAPDALKVPGFAATKAMFGALLGDALKGEAC